MWRSLATASCLAVLAGCATLPDSTAEQRTAHPATVDFAGTQGTVSVARSEAIIDRLEGDAGPSEILANHLAHEQAINPGSPLVLGNSVALLQDGPATYRAMFAAIRDAKDSVNLETYIFEDDEVGRAFADLLLEKQAAGVQVNLIYDSLGCIDTPTAFFDRLRAGGVAVLEYNTFNPLADDPRPWLPNNRDHRKLIVVDGRVAFVGGINISKVYSSSPFSRRVKHKPPAAQGWRDTHSRIEGPVVAEFQALFLATWMRQQGAPLAARDYFPTLGVRGDSIVRAISNRYDDGKSPIYLTLLSAITNAERSIHLTVAYFAPDPQLLRALRAAAKRGVEVVLVMPSNTDSWPIFNLGRSYYSGLLKAGVKIHERHGAVMHSKTVSIDGVWSTIGSTNLDWRSFLHNDELNAVVLSRDFTRQMDAMFASDLAESDQVLLAVWRDRPLWDRVKESFARLGKYWL